MATKVSKQAFKRDMAITRRVMLETAHNPDNHGLQRVHRDDADHTFPILTAHENEDLTRFDERLSWIDGLANVYVEEGDGQISFFTTSPQLPTPESRASDMVFAGELLGELLDHLYELEENEYLLYVGLGIEPVYVSKVQLFLKPETRD